MTLSRLSDTAQILAAIAVIPSLIFVGLQMRQNTRAVRASMSQAHANDFQEIIGRIYESEALTRIYLKGAFHPEQLDETERVRFMLMLAGQFRFFDASYAQYREGQLAEVHWRSIEKMILATYGVPGQRFWWDRRKDTLSDAFRAWYESQNLASSEPGLEAFNADTGNEAGTP